MRPRIVYIGGAGRSGSTLLGEMLGAQPRSFDMGELSLFWRDADRGGTCACGEVIAECQVWGPALDSVRVSHGVERSEWATLADSRARLASSRALGTLRTLARQGPSAWPDQVSRVVEVTDALVDAAAAITGSEVMVDASKVLTGLRFAELSGRDVSLIHLVRDPRAVVTSVRRSRSVERGNEESLPPGAGTLTATAQWLRTNALMGWGARGEKRHARTHYETLVAEPEAELARLCTALDLPFDRETVAGGELKLSGPSHAAVGNPMRRLGGVRTIRLDDGWRTELPRSSSLAVATVTLPVTMALARKR